MLSWLGSVLTGVAVVGGVALVGRRMRRDADELAPDPVDDMRSVPLVRLVSVTGEALVRVSGQVAPYQGLVTAPLSRTPCVAFRVELDVSGDDARRATDCITPFYLDGEGARALVLPPCPIVALAERMRHDGDADSLPRELAAWVDHNYAGSWRDARHLRVVERRIDPGDRLAVVGWASLADGATSAGYRDASQLVVIETADGAPLSLSDDGSLL